MRQAIADGVLVEVSEQVREAGFAWPLAMTAEVWALLAALPESHVWEDPAGRLWDVLVCARAASQSTPPGGSQVLFDVLLHHAGGSRLRLELVAGPGDRGEWRMYNAYRRAAGAGATARRFT